jgi:predicted ATPase
MITRITFPEAIAAKHGLKARTLDRLGRIVVLAGPNGSGKSRYLRALEESTAWFAGLSQQAESLTRHISVARPVLAKKDELVKVKAALELVTCDGPLVPAIRLVYPPESRHDQGVLSLSPEQRENLASQADQDFRHAYDTLHAFLADRAHVLYSDRHPDHAQDEGLANRVAEVAQLQEILRGLLGTALGYRLTNGVNVVPLLRGRQFKRSELSAGELLLLTWAISLHRQAARLADGIILIDEPELHLHPDACIKALERLRTQVLGPHGQIWLATHSVPLVAYGGVEALHLVRDGDIRYAGNDVPAVIESLVGGDGNRERLLTFLRDGDAIGFAKFALECVLPPGIAEPRAGDPQEGQLLDLVRQRLAGGGTLRLLDYGAGRGRFAAALAGALARDDLRGRVTYLGFTDPEFAEEGDSAACRERVAALGGRYYESWPELEAHVGAGNVDLVLLANVLHDVPPTEWLRVTGRAQRLLADDGWLVVMEDLVPAIGELPHAGGYLVLDHTALGVLFASPAEVQRLDDRTRPRLMVAAVPHRRLAGATQETVAKTLRHARDAASERLRALRRRGAADTATGREQAFLAVQLANATLALEAFGER